MLPTSSHPLLRPSARYRGSVSAAVSFRRFARVVGTGAEHLGRQVFAAAHEVHDQQALVLGRTKAAGSTKAPEKLRPPMAPRSLRQFESRGQHEHHGSAKLSSDHCTAWSWIFKSSMLGSEIFSQQCLRVQPPRL